MPEGMWKFRSAMGRENQWLMRNPEIAEMRFDRLVDARQFAEASMALEPSREGPQTPYSLRRIRAGLHEVRHPWQEHVRIRVKYNPADKCWELWATETSGVEEECGIGFQYESLWYVQQSLRGLFYRYPLNSWILKDACP